MSPGASAPTAASAGGGVLWPIGPAAAVPELEGRSVTIAGRRIAVFNTGKGFAAIDGRCPHRGGPLSDGLLADGCVTCPLHNWRVDLRNGEVVAGGEGLLRTYEVEDVEGELFLRIELEGSAPTTSVQKAPPRVAKCSLDAGGRS